MALQPPLGDTADAPIFPSRELPRPDADTWSAFIAFAAAGERHPADPPRALEGVTFAVKNNIHAASLATRAGSPALDAPITARDAEVVRRLKAAGAFCVGTLNMHELALGTTSANAFFGTVLNPVAPGRSAGGSSGGSAAAVAANLVSFTLSTDTGGSSRIPAAYCGVVGLRPTSGRYPSDGIIALSPTRDTVGVMARTVAQVARVDAVITGEHGGTSPAPPELRLGVPRTLRERLDPEVDAAFSLGLDQLSEAGVLLIDIDPGDHHDADAALAIVAWESPRAILALRGLEPSPSELTVTELAELADFIEEVASPDVRALLTAFTNEPLSATAYESALVRRETERTAAQRTFEINAIHALVYPTVPITAPAIGAATVALNGTHVPIFPVSIRNTDPGAFTGAPSLTVPLLVPPDGLPVGLGLEGLPGLDRDLLAIASLIEGLLTAKADRI